MKLFIILAIDQGAECIAKLHSPTILAMSSKLGLTCRLRRKLPAIATPATLFLCREIPQELIRAARGGEVDINIEDKRNEPYSQRKHRLIAFTGEGHKLGR